jgi:hypothetical protein
VGNDNALLFAGIVTEAAIIGLLLYRRVWRTLPFFCSYVVWGVVSDAADYIAQRQFAGVASRGYLITYVITQAVSYALQFCVLVELAWSILSPLRPSLSKRTPFLIGLLILAIGAAIWPFTGIHGLETQAPGYRILVHMEQTTSVLRILIFVVLAGCSQLLSIGWRDRELQVATGLGFYSFVNVAVDILRQHQDLGPKYYNLDRIVVVSYLCSLLYWAFSFAQKEATRREFTPQMQHFLLAVAGSARATRMNLPDSRPGKSRNREE